MARQAPGSAAVSAYAAPAVPRLWTPTNGRAGQASRRAERRSSRAGEETRLIIMPHGHASPVAPGHRNRPTFGTRHALATTSDSRALAAAGPFLARAAELSVDERLRATRLLAAADAELTVA